MKLLSFLRRLFPYGLIVPVFLGVIGIATAAELVRVDNATSFETVQQNIQKLTQDMTKAMCGAWDFEQHLKPVGGGSASAGASASTGESRIIKVEGFPGHEGKVFSSTSATSIPIPLDILKSGLADRDEFGGRSGNGFLFPESTKGITTACEVDKSDVQKNCTPKFPYIHDPYYDDKPSCIARQDLDPPPPNGAFERRCSKICDELNNWVRDVVMHDPDGDILWRAKKCRREGCTAEQIPPPHSNYPKCFDEPPDYEDHCTTTEVFCCTDAVLGDIDNANCIPCQGDGTNDADGGCRVGKIAPNGSQYVSFYRKYTGSFEREKVEKTPADDKNKMYNLNVKCYSRYTEFDPKLQYTTKPDRHCVLDLELSPDNLEIFKNMKVTQKGKGKKWGQDSRFSDPTYSSSSRSNLNNLWVTNLDTAFSMLNGEQQEKQYKDVPLTLIPLDTAFLMPTAQISKINVFSSGSLIRAFDDTVSIRDPGGGASTMGVNYARPGRRTIAEWWQEQETEMHKLLTPPILRILLPTPESEDLVMNHPLLTPTVTSTDPPKPKDNYPPGTKVIDIQLRTVPDDLAGEVAAYLTDALLIRIEEEPVTVVVPLASPVELRALAQGWRSWGKEREALGDSAGSAEQIADKLEKYAATIDEVRALRGELLQYIGEILKFQKEMMSSIADWHKNNVSALNSYNSQWQERVALQSQWQAIQAIYRKFNDQTNFPWCRNDRFTTPVYSLLDYWMPSQINPRDLAVDIDDPPSESVDISTLPRIKVNPMPDLVYDFTALRVGSGIVKLPVLKPLQIRLDLHRLQPPSFNQSKDDVADQVKYINQLPGDLPQVPTIFKEVKEKLLPLEVLKNSPPPPLSETLDPPEVYIAGEMSRMMTMLQMMDRTHKDFWTSLTEDRRSQLDKWNCLNTDALPCVHVEMDLLERFARIGARPAVFLIEDFLSIGSWRSSSSLSAGAPVPRYFVPDPIKTRPACPRADWACQVINTESTKQRSGWRSEGMKEKEFKDALEKIRKRMRDETIPKNTDAALPYAVTPNELFPPFASPPPQVLRYPLSSYSSSSISATSP